MVWTRSISVGRTATTMALTCGTAAKARVDGFIVAGKTGTAQMVNPENGTYYQNRHVSSFVGFLPADDPRLLILVALYDVGHEHFGAGRRRFVGGGYYGDGLDCPYNPYYTSYNWPYTCTY